MVFFVLSGYLVGGGVITTLKKQTWSWPAYLMKRMTRLWVVLLPALLLGVALDCTGLHLFPSPDSIYSSPPDQDLIQSLENRLSLPVVVGNAVFLQTLVVKTAGTNESLWSLANEFWYYIAFPVALLALRKQQSTLTRIAYMLAFAGIIMLLGWSAGLLFFIWLLGAATSLLPRRMAEKAARIGALSMAFLLPFVFLGVRRAPLPRYVAECLVAVYFAIMLYMILHLVKQAKRDYYQKISTFFSQMSYSLYLVHLPLAVLLCAFVNTPWHNWKASPQNIAIYLVLNLIVISVSRLFYLLFEGNTDKVRHFLFPPTKPIEQ